MAVAGEIFLAMRRFVPDFKDLQGNAKVTLLLKALSSTIRYNTSLSPLYN